jgi:hypothetical protein
LNISYAFSTGSLFLGVSFDISFHLSLPVIFFVLDSSLFKLLFALEQSYPSLYYINPLSPFDLRSF